MTGVGGQKGELGGRGEAGETVSEFNLGLLDLVLLPVALPLKAAWLGIEKAAELAAEADDPEARRLETMADLQAALELGEISEEQYERMWAALEGGDDRPGLRPAEPGEEP